MKGSAPLPASEGRSRLGISQAAQPARSAKFGAKASSTNSKPKLPLKTLLYRDTCPLGSTARNPTTIASSTDRQGPSSRYNPPRPASANKTPEWEEARREILQWEVGSTIRRMDEFTEKARLDGERSILLIRARLRELKIRRAQPEVLVLWREFLGREENQERWQQELR